MDNTKLSNEEIERIEFTSKLNLDAVEYHYRQRIKLENFNLKKFALKEALNKSTDLDKVFEYADKIYNYLKLE